MCIIKLYKKIDKRLKQAPVRILNFYNNLISGLIGGTIVYFLFITKFKINWLSLVYLIFLYIIGLYILLKTDFIKNKNSRKKQIKDYHFNLIAAILGSMYITIVSFFPEKRLIHLISGLILIILFVMISY